VQGPELFQRQREEFVARASRPLWRERLAPAARERAKKKAKVNMPRAEPALSVAEGMPAPTAGETPALRPLTLSVPAFVSGYFSGWAVRP